MSSVDSVVIAIIVVATPLIAPLALALLPPCQCARVLRCRSTSSTWKNTKRLIHLLLLFRCALALGSAVAGCFPKAVLCRFGARPFLGVGALLLGGLRHGRLAVFCLFLGHREALAPGPGVRLREQDRRRLGLEKKSIKKATSTTSTTRTLCRFKKKAKRISFSQAALAISLPLSHSHY